MPARSIPVPFSFIHPLLLIVASSSVLADSALADEASKLATDHLVLHPELRIEVIAAEPEVVDPVAIAFDERQRLWVVEMRDYPNGPGEGEPPKSRIRCLRDADGDGYYETATTFADELLFPTGLQPWRDGVLVTLAGQLVFMRDTDGDSRMDEKEVWLSGFAEENPQLRANHPTLAYDNHIYIANGLRGGSLKKSDGSEVSIRGRDVRLNPFDKSFAAIAGNGQFGLTFDLAGNRFICSNRNPCMQVMLENEQLARNPKLRVPRLLHDVHAAGVESKLYPLSNNWTTSNLHAEQFTAACGVTFYFGDALPEKFHGNGFTCDPTGNLVRRFVVTPSGSTFDSKPGRDGVEFLASANEFFRPVNMASGPDGALYVVDMHRKVIEHPQFMPDELKQRPDLRIGDDLGRIYRITAKRQSVTNPEPLESDDLVELVDALSDENAWRRETAARLILQRGDKAVLPLLQNVLVASESREARIHALWLLDGLNGLTEKHVASLLRESDPLLLQHTLRLAGKFVTQSESIRASLGDLLRHADSHVRFRAVLAAGEFEVLNSDELIAMTRTLLDSSLDDWMRTAIFAVIAGQEKDVLSLCLASQAGDVNGAVESLRELARMASQGAKANELDGITAALVEHDHGFSTVASVLLGMAESNSGYVRTLLARAEWSAFQEKCIAMSGERNPSLAIEMSQFLPSDVARIPLLEIIESNAVESKKLMATQSLSRHLDQATVEKVTGLARASQPRIQEALFDCLLRSSLGTDYLLAQFEDEELSSRLLNPSQVRRLQRHSEPAIRQRIGALLAKQSNPDRAKVIAEYQAALQLAGDADAGRMLFKQNCAVCHRVGDLGTDLAPDISDSRTKQPSELLVSILDPNRAIDNNYFSYTAITSEGVVHNGLFVTETDSTVTLKTRDGKELSLAKAELEEFVCDDVSFMPTGFEKTLSKQQLADVIAFVKNWRYLDGAVPLGKK